MIKIYHINVLRKKNNNMQNSLISRIGLYYILDVFIILVISIACAFLGISETNTLFTQALCSLLFIYLANRYWIKAHVYFKPNISLMSQIKVNVISIMYICLFLSILIKDLTFSFKTFFFILLAGLYAVGEEYLFRGVILYSLINHFKDDSIILSVFLTSFLFGLTHIINLTDQSLSLTSAQMLSAMALSLFLCSIYLRTKSLLWPISVHFILDASGFLSTGVNQSNDTPITVSIIPFILALGIMLFLLRKSKRPQILLSLSRAL